MKMKMKKMRKERHIQEKMKRIEEEDDDWSDEKERRQ